MSDDRSAPLISRRSFAWLAAVLFVVVGVGSGVLVNRARRAERWPTPVRPATAMGDSTCLSCHADKASYEGTAHRLTSRHPSPRTMAGDFTGPRSVLRTPNPALHFRMSADSAGFHQTAVEGTGKDTTTRTERVAYVAGSNRKGQSYLYWRGDSLYQMPISYWKTLNTWINSPGPGYTDGRANFDRAVAPRCFECHATWIDAKPDLGVVNRFDSTGAILGITCERCHAGGREHVRRQRAALTIARGPAIVNPARLTRERQMDACAQCHGGIGRPKVPSFTYVAGQRLEDYVELAPPPPTAQVDVHGNQVALLQRSRCYQASQMTCTTCHDVHATQRDPKQLSGKCMTCHQEQSCKLFPTQGRAIAGRCVDCHMPLQSSNLIVSALEGQSKQAQVRSHWIRVYRDSVSR
ncbi:MAG TPA: multiheme c-type cytochrome [Gemmatimonadaceae bacterium]|nr:multiheme c-type cytochrome [Gemmatimonadaceae bacterium]